MGICLSRYQTYFDRSKLGKGLAYLCASILIGVGAVGQSTAAESVKIGAILPLTGPVADIGNNSRQGMVWAAEEINKNGGIKSLGGAEIELVFGDTESKTQAGMSAMQKLLSVDKVPVVTGAFQSATTLPTARLAERAKTPYLVFSSIADSITEQGYKYTFRPHAAAKQWATQQFDFLHWLNENKVEELGREIKKIGFLYENTEYGQATAKNWVVEAEERGYEVVADLSYPLESTNMTSIINRLRHAEPDAVLLVSYVSDAILIAKTFKETGYTPPIQVATGGGQSDIAFLNSGHDVEGLFTVANWNDDIDKPFTKVFVEGYEARWDAAPSSHSAQGMMNIYVLKEALEAAASTDPADIAEALRNYETTNVPPAIAGADKISFDADGQDPYPEIVLTQIDNGKYRTVYPEDVASIAPKLNKLPAD